MHLKLSRGEDLDGAPEERSAEAEDDTEGDSDDSPDDDSPEWGEFDDNGEYKFLVDIGELSAKLGVPVHVLERGAKEGFSPQDAVEAKTNPYTAEDYRDAGIAWGA